MEGVSFQTSGGIVLLFINLLQEKRDMRRFKNILVVENENAQDRSALERAAGLAETNQAALSVVQVIQALPRELQRITVLDPDDLRRMIQEEQEEKLKRRIASIASGSLQVSSKVLFGTPFLEIIREVVRNNHDLVMMAAEGRGGLSQSLFGSTEMHLMRKCPCPVWITKSNESRRYARIAAAVDPDPSDAEKTALNLKILELARALALRDSGELHIVHAWRLEWFWQLHTHRELSQEKIDGIKTAMKSTHEQWLKELVESANPQDVHFQVHLLDGEAGAVIPEFSREKQIDALVMGTVCRTGIEGFLIGNTAEKILPQVDCSVLTVKPDGFVTPARIV